MKKNSKNHLLTLLGLLLIYSCNTDKNKTTNETISLKKGTWKTLLHVQENKELPFIMDVVSDSLWIVKNAEERIEINNIKRWGDSIQFQTPVFEGFFIGIIEDESTITGDFIKPSLNRVVPFTMNASSQKRFAAKENPKVEVTGNWETVFSPKNETNRYIAKGIFKQQGETVTGTFRTTTGDYRYLEGIVTGDSLKLSTFDGAHAFLFEAKVTDSTMVGVFYSGNHWEEPFVAEKNETYELPSAESLTYLKEGYDSFYFSFPDKDGNTISLNDPEFKDKIVIVQIMGTWCPNCLDESKYYSQFYEKNRDKDIAFVGLAFEYAKTEEKAFQAIQRLQEDAAVNYPILLAQYGTSSKKKANEKLPMLNHVLSYPTTIFIDKEREVRKIHTGFNGPATGEKYKEFTKDFEYFITELLDDK